MAYNEYDDPHFFEEYAKMGRSQGGLPAAGEWHQLQPLFPLLEGKAVLDLGCGYGWHCKYAAEQGAMEPKDVTFSRWKHPLKPMLRKSVLKELRESHSNEGAGKLPRKHKEKGWSERSD